MTADQQITYILSDEIGSGYRIPDMDTDRRPGDYFDDTAEREVAEVRNHVADRLYEAMGALARAGDLLEPGTPTAEEVRTAYKGLVRSALTIEEHWRREEREIVGQVCELVSQRLGFEEPQRFPRMSSADYARRSLNGGIDGTVIELTERETALVETGVDYGGEVEGGRAAGVVSAR